MRAQGSHGAYGACARLDHGAAPEDFKIDKKSTESLNFPLSISQFHAVADQTSLLRVVELYVVNYFA